MSSSEPTPPPDGQRSFGKVLANTLVANVTSSYLWWALTFWIYLETRSVLATGIVGGLYMLLTAVFAMAFGTIVDRHRKHRVMVLSSVITLTCFVLAGVVYLVLPHESVASLSSPGFWLFALIVLVGGVVEQLRNIALSTTVTLLVPAERRANANGLVGTVQGMAMIVTSVFSGLSVGLLGMGWTIVVAIALTAVSLVHLLTIRIPEAQPDPAENSGGIDVRGAWAAVRAIPGLLGLIIFSTFNNLIGGAFMALMDPYGLELFRVEIWGVVLAVCTSGFIVGGLLIARFGLGSNPIRTMLVLCAVTGLIGAVFTLREVWWLFVIGCFAYMCLIPAIEAAEQTVIQTVVPFARQGRVFGFAQAFEAAAAPITSFAIAPIAEFWIIPHLRTPEGAARWNWLLGSGDARGIALVFLVAGLAMVLIALVATRTRTYGVLSAGYAGRSESVPVADSPAA